MKKEDHTTRSPYWWKYLDDHELNRLLQIERGVALPQVLNSLFILAAFEHPAGRRFLGV